MLICSKKQKMTLLLFAQNYSLQTIADKMGVHLTTTRERLKRLAKNHQREFDTAFSIRNTYKRNKDKIKDIQYLTGDLDRFETIKQLF